MIRGVLFSVLILSLFIVACGDESSTENATTKVAASKGLAYETLKTGVLLDMKGRDEAALAYSLYLPTGYQANTKVPLVLLLDAHSRTHTSLKQYIATCEKLHIAMACSGNSRNGLDINTTNTIVQKTLDDITSRVHIDSGKLYLAGFSGGARVASAACTIDKRVKGVITCAAGIDQSINPSSLPVPFVLIAGIRDMNSTELYELNGAMVSPHGFMLFNGIHEWAPDSIMRKGIGALLQNNVNTLTDQKKLSAIFTKDMLAKENDLRPQLQGFFQSNAWDELLKKIIAMKALSQSDPHPDVRAMQQRMLSLCGMFCFFAVPRATDINKALLVYETADPANPDLWFFKAMNASKTDKAKAKTYLAKAADLGFYDMQRLNQEPSLQGIADDAILKRIGDNN